MRHLDERVSDLVDDRLEHEERDRALAHLAVCAECRGAFEYERTAKSALRSLPDAEPSDKLTSALLGLAEPGGLLPDERSGLAKSAPVAGWRDPDTRSAAELASDPASSQARRLGFTARKTRLAAAGVISASGVVALLAAMGAPPEEVSRNTPVSDAVSIAPTADAFLLEHARTTGGLPFTEPASYLAPMLPVGEEAR